MDDPLSNWIINFMNIDAMLWMEMFGAHNVYFNSAFQRMALSTKLSFGISPSLSFDRLSLCLMCEPILWLFRFVCVSFYCSKKEKIMLSISYQLHIHFSRLESQQFRFDGFFFFILCCSLSVFVFRLRPFNQCVSNILARQYLHTHTRKL